MARVVASVVVAVFLQLTASCSLVGLCIGAATPQTRTVVRFDANAPIPEGCAPETRPVALVPAGDARSLSCREGNHALAGFFVGLVVDLTLFAIALSRIESAIHDSD